MAISCSKRTSEWAAKPWGAEEIGSSHSLFPHLPLISCFACHLHVTSLREIALRLLRLSICERWLHHHHNSSLNSKCTRTPESICDLLWLSTSEQKRTKLLKHHGHGQDEISRLMRLLVASNNINVEKRVLYSFFTSAFKKIIVVSCTDQSCVRHG